MYTSPSCEIGCLKLGSKFTLWSHMAMPTKCPGNRWTLAVTGGKVNRGGGYGLEVPCVYMQTLWTKGVHWKDEGVGELPENSRTSLPSSVIKVKRWVWCIINRGLWLVWLCETRLWPSVRYLEVILYWRMLVWTLPVFIVQRREAVASRRLVLH